MDIKKSLEKQAEKSFDKEIGELDHRQLHALIASCVMRKIYPRYSECLAKKRLQKTAYYLSAEFLMGRAVYSNLKNMRCDEQVKELLDGHGADFSSLEDIEDAALGNGGLGRLAACFLDSGASLGLNLDGYGIRYKYGLFRQKFEDGFQKEYADDWHADTDPWSVRKESDAKIVRFKNFSVKAVPYDMPIIGYDLKQINRLRLWQCEPTEEFDFAKFDAGNYSAAYKAKERAESISAVLYPNDSSSRGRRLRLMQEYFFTSASVQDVLDRANETGADMSDLDDHAVFQLNDTHPALAVPELIRLLMQRGTEFDDALNMARKVFAYTNHTVMGEALEKWDVKTLKQIVPDVYKVIAMIDAALRTEFRAKGISEKGREIIEGGTVYMARLACFVCRAVNGVARIHTEIIKEDTLKEWYEIYPEKFFNMTNGITQRRWLLTANPRLAEFVTQRIGDKWITDLDELERLLPYADKSGDVKEFARIKLENKRDLCRYILKKEGISLCEDFIFDVQIKRLHEYKRQLLNAFSLVYIYNGLKNGSIKDFYPTVFIFGAKAAPAYFRAKGIIKYINEIAKKINADPETSDRLKAVFVSDYNVSYAEKIVAAANVSEQISAAGTEASGTGNMKLMLNGAVTLGTYDGANIEIAEAAGEENEYIFGARVEDLKKIKGAYDPKKLYKEDAELRAVVDTLIDGTFDDGGSGMFGELYDSLLEGASWHRPDNYFVLLDFADYVRTKLKVNADYRTEGFMKKCFVNTARSGRFSSDRTVSEYAKHIWKI